MAKFYSARYDSGGLPIDTPYRPVGGSGQDIETFAAVTATHVAGAELYIMEIPSGAKLGLVHVQTDTPAALFSTDIDIRARDKAGAEVDTSLKSGGWVPGVAGLWILADLRVPAAERESCSLVATVVTADTGNVIFAAQWW